MLIFVGTLAVTMPAAVVAKLVELPPQVEALSGSVWSGRAAISGGYALTWDTSFGGLIVGRITLDGTFAGADTQVTGSVRLSPWSVMFTDVQGRAGPGLLALLPGLPVTACTSRAIIDVGRAGIGRSWAAADGTVLIAAGTCTDRGGTDLTVPALRMTMQTDGRDARAQLTTDDDAATLLASVMVAGDRRLIVRVEPDGARLVPGMPSSAATELEYPF